MRWFAILALVLPLGISPAQAQQKQYCSPEVYMQPAIDASIKVCDAIVANPRQPLREHIQAYENLGDLNMRKQQPDMAMRYYDQAVALIAKATKFTQSMFDKDTPTSVSAITAGSVFYQRGQAFRVRGQHARAIDDYAKAIHYYANDSQAYWHRADSYEALGQIDRAIQDLDKALTIQKEQTLYIQARGLLYLKKKDFDRAIQDFNSIVGLQPKSSDAINGRGLAYMGKGAFDLALKEFDAAVSLNASSNYLNNRGLMRRKTGDIEGALADFSDAITHADSTNTAALAGYLVNRAELFGEKGEWLKALEDNQTALTLVPYLTKATAGRDAARLVLSTPPPAQLAAAPAAPAAKPLTAGALSERRVALVIGNSAYQAVTALPNPTHDAATVAQALRTVGFQVVQVASDLSRDQLARALQAFAAESDKADWAVIYYGGHGIEMGGVNYLIPVDAKLKADRDVGLEAIALDQALAAVSGARKLRLVVLDACRDNPFVARMTRTVAGRSIRRGLASVEPEGGTLVAFAAKDGQTALDGEAGRNSPFVASFVKNLQRPGVEISKMFRLIRDDVLAATGKQQEPFTYGSLPGQDFFFREQ